MGGVCAPGLRERGTPEIRARDADWIAPCPTSKLYRRRQGWHRAEVSERGTVLPASHTTVPTVPRPMAVCTPLFSQGLDPLGVGHTGTYTGHLGPVGPDVRIGRCGDPPPPGRNKGDFIRSFSTPPRGGVGVLTVAAQSRWVRTWRLCASAAFWDYAVYTESAAAQQWPRSKKWRLF